MIVADRAKLSIIIVNYFSERSLRRCLRSLAAASTPVEVVVVDNGSDPEQRESVIAACPDAVWVDAGSNIGFAAASNLGAARARSSKLLFLNPDTVVAPNALAELAAALDTEEHALSILGCALDNEDGTLQLSCRRFPDWRTFVSSRFSLLTRLFPENSWSSHYLMKDFGHDTVRHVDWVSGAAMAMSRAVFELLDGFDERFFMYFEDVDLCHRAAGMGVDTVYFPKARVEHQIGGSSAGSPVRALVYRHRSMWTYYRRYHGRLWQDPFAGTLILGRFTMMVAQRILRRTVESLRQPDLETQSIGD